MKSSRSSSVGERPRRRSDSTIGAVGHRPAASNSSMSTAETSSTPKPPLRRSTREREAPQTPQTDVVMGSPKSRGRSSGRNRRARGLPANRVDTTRSSSEGADDVPATLAPPLSPKIEDSAVGNTSSESVAQELIATRKRGGNVVAVRVHIVVDGKLFVMTRSRNKGADTTTTNSHTVTETQSAKKRSKKSATTTFLGQDGNLFYCGVCQGFGDVVCCDGCPSVYHPSCLPKGTPSRTSLDNDDDPWYCPDCIKKMTPVKKEPRSGSRRAIKHRCMECQQIRSDLSLVPCKVCGVHIHHPSCRDIASKQSIAKASLCSSCRAEAALTEEELELHAKKKQRMEGDSVKPRIMEGDVNTPRQVASPTEELGVSYSMEHNTPGTPISQSFGTAKKRKRQKHASPDDLQPTSSEKKKKKKKKRKKEGRFANDESPLKMADGSSPQSTSAPQEEGSHFGTSDAAASHGPPTQATPAFHFYLVEQRPKVEKLLARKHPVFLRLPKGGERNALIAKETAKQWIKLSSVDQKKYIEMSMRDYENRIIRWKAEKNVQAMTAVGEVEGAPDPVDDLPVEEPNDDILTYEMYERLYQGTSVGSKPFKPEPNQSHNRVLLDLLRDMRFHPLPMFNASRPDVDLDSAGSSSSKSGVCIRHFDVHGPVATSVGDECLGCTRGWPHFCPVLQRRMPAAEHRSKLQPATSALISSRVGLGLRPRMERIEIDGDDEVDGMGGSESEIFSWKETREENERKRLRFVPSGTLGNPSKRADDIVEFIEEVVAMKIPEPSRPSPPSMKNDFSPRKSLMGRGILPTRHKRASDSDAVDNCGYEHINKCGRCRTIIMDDKGCVQCRRAQLVINMSRHLSPTSEEQQHDGDEPLKVQTAMLGRVITKESIGEAQAESDKAISAALLKVRWAPCAILPPSKALAPSPSSRTVRNDSPDNPEDRQPKTGGHEILYRANSNADKKSNQNLEDFGDSQTKTEASSELRPRNARKPANTPSSLHNEDIERQIVAKKYREEAEKLQKRCVSVACSGILLALIRRDPLLLFAQPVSAEGYSQVVRTPIDFGVIKKRVMKSSYNTLGAFMADARLLCENSLIFNPPGSVYWKTAKELLDVLPSLQKRGNKWMNAVKNAHSSAWRKSPKKRSSERSEDANDHSETRIGDPFKTLRKTWPEAVDMYENADWLKSLLTADFARTKENETAFYGSLAVRRAAKAAEVCLAPYPDTGGIYSAVVKRSHLDDEDLRNGVDQKVSEIIDPVQLRDIATGREETIVRLMRRVQSRRLEHRIGSENGCARCDGMGVGLDQEMKAVMNADAKYRQKRRGDAEGNSRVAQSRLDLTTGLASKATRDRIEHRREQGGAAAFESPNDVCVSLRGSRIHGLGLFSEQHFKKGEVVAEYLGECVTLPVAEAREKLYQAMRIQDYQFRLDDSQIIDATTKGGLGRYVNHNCNPNCCTKIIPGKPPNEHLRRVLILAARDIEPREELTYDYQFPLELNLEARIPCNCQSESCRGFMNWDLPEKGANTGALRTQKRGANMRDRIRRLGRPLKK